MAVGVGYVTAIVNNIYFTAIGLLPGGSGTAYSILLSHLPSYFTISCTSIEFVCDQILLSVAETYDMAHPVDSQNGRSTM